MTNFFEAIKIPPQFIMSLWLFFFIIVIGTFIFWLLYFRNRPSISKYQYELKGSIMTQSELSFFKVLLGTVGDQYDVFPQIHLDAILNHKISGQNWTGAHRHIDEKSVDFVLCDKTNTKPILAIELDDRSHEREDRKERDREVERIFKDANFPLLRIKDKSNFTREEILKNISDILTKN